MAGAAALQRRAAAAHAQAANVLPDGRRVLLEQTVQMARADTKGDGHEGRRELTIAHVQIDIGLDLRALLRRVEHTLTGARG